MIEEGPDQPEIIGLHVGIGDVAPRAISTAGHRYGSAISRATRRLESWPDSATLSENGDSEYNESSKRCGLWSAVLSLMR
jgi:hypothetical protein